jgi:uncharacterized protein with LGFP repeats
VRRLLVGLLAFLGLSGTILILPVWAAPAPEPEPVTTSTDEVAMGSVADPAPAADVQEGTTEPVAGVADTTPTLTVTKTGVDEFSLVGVTWTYDPAVTDTVVQVRVQDAAGRWGGWTPVGVEDAEQNPSADSGQQLRGGTAPLWTGPSTGVEVELVTRSGAQPTDVQLDLVDPGDSAADGALGAPEIQDTADAALAMPDVYSRKQWGADERIRTWDPEYARTITAATLHHTADTNNYTADQVPAMMRSIYRYHTVSRGWGDIGYNVIVDKFGRRWEGRYGGLASTVIGAHAGGFNTGTFGVSMLGNYDLVGTPQAMIDSVAAIIAWKFSLYNVDPRTTTLVSGGGGTAKYAKGTSVRLPTIFGHRDVGATSCPGQYGYARLPEIRDKVTRTLLSQPQQSISQRYASDAPVRQVLGTPVGTEQVTAGVRWQQYQFGRMYWTARTGAHVLVGDILATYLAAGGPAAFGAPTTDETAVGDDAGRYNDFSGDASVYWTAQTGARIVQGQIRNLWQLGGGPFGALGYPLTDEAAGHGGRWNQFQGGVGFWTPAGGAVEVHGDIYRRWQALGGWAWAAPTSSEKSVGAGRYNAFGTDRGIYWSKATGAHAVQGPIHRRWTSAGGAAGAMGFPTAEEQSASGGVRFSPFQNGGVYWTGATGAHAVAGAIARKWANLGGLDSGFGVPVTDELSTPDRVGRFTVFANGAAIYWTKGTGAQSIQGRIWERWGAMGWERGPLGYPTTDEQPTEDGRGRFNLFQNGSLVWTPAYGAHAVYGEIFRSWLSLGAVRSKLGYPTSDEYAVRGGRATDFEHGRITWNATTGKITVSTR